MNSGANLSNSPIKRDRVFEKRKTDAEHVQKFCSNKTLIGEKVIETNRRLKDLPISVSFGQGQEFEVKAVTIDFKVGQNRIYHFTAKEFNADLRIGHIHVEEIVHKYLENRA